MASSRGARRSAPNKPSQIQPPGESLLLLALPDVDRAAILPHFELVYLEFGRTIYKADEPITDVYFPTDAIISMVSDMAEGTVEVGTVGREGMSGLAVLLHARTMPTRAYVQVPGYAYRIGVDLFLNLVDSYPALQELLYEFARALFDLVAQTAACNRLHSLEERCARWLAMTQDRVARDQFELKQKVLAEMLGVHRPAVTVAAGTLQRAGLIRYARGRVTVVDRGGLEAAACGCYEITRRWVDILETAAHTSGALANDAGQSMKSYAEHNLTR